MREETGLLKLRSIKKERKARVASGVMKTDAIDQGFDQCVRKYRSGPDISKLLAIYDFVKRIKYKHSGFSNSVYFVHPVRVACLAMQLTPSVDLDTLTIALLHNALEISNLTFEDFKKRFGSRVAKSIRLLSVDRSRQKSRAYRSLYYKRLDGAFRGARIVKVLDKLDNLFLLCTNSDDKARESYLKEIEDYIIPLADRDLKDISGYYRKLVKDCRRIGYLNVTKI